MSGVVVDYCIYVDYYSQANGQSKTSLLAAYGASITLRAGGEEEPARDILVKLVEEMEQVKIKSNISFIYLKSRIICCCVCPPNDAPFFFRVRYG